MIVASHSAGVAGIWDDVGSLLNKVNTVTKEGALDVCAVSASGPAQGAGAISTFLAHFIPGTSSVAVGVNAGNKFCDTSNGGAPAAPQYPAGSIGRQYVKTKMWSIYAPKAAATAAVGTMTAPKGPGFYGAGLDCSCGPSGCGPCSKPFTPGFFPSPPTFAVSNAGLGLVAPPAGTVKVATTAALPAGVVNGGTEDDVPWYKNWHIWAGVAGGAVVIGGGALAVHAYRKRSK